MAVTTGSIDRLTKGSTREERGVALAEERFEEIVKIRPWTWSVPSADGSTAYEVNLKHETCSCPDRTPEGERCKHVVAVLYKKARTGECAGCRNRYRFRELIEVTEDHGSLTWFPGDLLCGDCERACGGVA